MSQLDPPKHGSGGGGEPNVKKLHTAFLYLKFSRLGLIISLGMILYGFIGEGIIIQNYNSTFLGLFPLNHDIGFWFFVVATITWIVGGSWLIKGVHKKYRLVRYAHISYCKCDRTRWYNKE